MVDSKIWLGGKGSEQCLNGNIMVNADVPGFQQPLQLLAACNQPCHTREDATIATKVSVFVCITYSDVIRGGVSTLFATKGLEF